MAAVIFYEPEGEMTAPLLRGVTLIAPLLLSLELASICLKKIKREPARTQDFVAGFNLRSRLAIEERPVDLDGVLALARSTGLTAYDACYLWLARSLSAELVTLDKQLARAAV